MKGPAVRPDRITGNGLLTNKVPRATVETPMREHVPGAAEKTVREAPYRACDSVRLDLFFPTSDAAPADRRQIEAAKTHCRRCPVLDACRQFGLEAMPHGVVGGLTEWERREVRGKRAG